MSLRPFGMLSSHNYHAQKQTAGHFFYGQNLGDSLG